MKRHPSDRHIQRQLEHHQTPFDAEALWTNIEAEIQPQKRSRRWLFLLFLFGIIGIATTWYILISNDDNIETDHNSTIVNPTDNQAAIVPSPVNKNDQELLSDNSLTLPSTNNSPAEKSTTINTQSSIKNNSNKQKTNLTKHLSIAQTKSEDSPKNRITSNQLTTNYTASTQQVNITNTNESNNLKSVDQQSIDESGTNNKSISPIQALKSLDYTLLRNPFPTIPTIENATPPAPPISRNGYSPWSLTARIGIGSTLQDLSSNADSLRDYQASRKLSEKQLETLSLELGLQWTSKQGWYLRSGLGYRQTAERFSFSSSVTETVRDSGIVKIIISPGGEADTIRDLITGMRTTEFRKTTYNRYRFIEIPIIAGYNFGEGPFTFGVEAGIVPQFLFQITGEIEGLDGNFTSLETVSETQLAWSLHSAFNINYALNDQWQIQLSPTFRYQFTNLHKADYPLQVSYHSLGAQLGVRYAW